MHSLRTNDKPSSPCITSTTTMLPRGTWESSERTRFLLGTVKGKRAFVNACRINHDCDNNAQKSWNENINRHTVHAKRDIENGEEITIFYLGVLNNRKTRQEALRSKFRFTILCRLCSLPPDQSQEKDRKLSEILTLDGLIGRDGMMGILSAPLRKLRYVDQQIRLYNELGPNDNGLPRAFIDAAQIAITHGDLARARIFAKRAVLGWIVLEGDDGSQVLQYRALTQEPSKHELYGTTMKWKTAIDNIPVGLDSGDFDDWLWRRDKPKQLGQPVDLRNRTTFPGFNDLPDENDVDLEFYASSDGFTYRPHRHWLFLAEIVDFATKWTSKMLRARRFRSSSIQTTGAMNWHLHKFRKGTQLRFSTQSVTHSCFPNRESGSKSLRISRYFHYR
ncbi:hypothetical protein GMDG_06871 [Pseudogymnoascus destructans 20631-21]|uniref:SET domain-containing protein n=1 Tax=Pseudogymnoascus destructans (strain ATCC MYA-4855 / 20631-21) TaxID=658429 RepID=L8FVR7_PSED2|nr:hypothetical protein GMDG_06871 [Pseudogymnoascus destructans 20631-21]